tara:strand:- start:1292 stop:1738 length:447 start_codon:yes stop_codon:yes gene_type:complete
MKITKRQLKRIIREEKQNILAEGLEFENEYAEDAWKRLPQQFQEVAQGHGWSLDSLEGYMESEVGDGEFTLVLSKDEYVFQCEYSYTYRPYGGDMEYWYIQLAGPGVSMVFRHGGDEGIIDDIKTILQAFERASVFSEDKFRSELGSR